MTSFLITFKPASENPKRGWPLSELQKLVHRLNNGEPAEEAWRFINRKDTKIGDRVFLLLQGKIGPTIIGYGRINGSSRTISGTAQIPVKFEGLVDPLTQAFATREELFVIEGGERFWRTQSSGVKLEDKVAADLEKLVVGRSPKAMAYHTITRERLNFWIFEALRLLRANNGRYRSRDLINELEKTLDLTPQERSLNNSGHRRWQTSFRFHSIGLVKAGLVKKEGGFWKLVNTEGVDLEKLTPKSLAALCDQRYREWLERRDKEAGETGVSPRLIEDTFETPLQNLKIDPRKVSFDELLRGVNRSLIQIPPFQREFVWETRRICFLLDSIYRGYPIGSFIFWKTTRRLPHHRSIGGMPLDDVPQGSVTDYVLDGQQRITSLYAAVRGAGIQGEKYNFSFNLTTGKFQAEKVQENDFEQPAVQVKIPLAKLFVDSRAEYVRYTSEFPDSYQDVLHDLYDRFKLYAFSVIFVQEEAESDDDEQGENIKRIVNIFSRINGTGKPLSVVAKMIARCWGEGFEIREKFEELYEENAAAEEIREETILQIASAILNQRRCRTADILDTTDIQMLEQEWDSIVEAFKLALEFVKNKIKIKNLKYLPFDSLLGPVFS